MKSNKHILMITIGRSPQVITELIYYFSHPHYSEIKEIKKIIIFTTKIGKEEIINNLFNRNILSQMIKKLKISLDFSEKDIIVIKDKQGSDITDTTDTKSNLYSMNTIFDTFKKYSNKKNPIIASIAGGRKSMSSMMSLTFQMLARKEDKLIHIVAPDKKMFDGLNNNDPNKWYYPSDPKNKDETLTVSEVPTLKIGSYLPVKLNGSFDNILLKLQNYIVDLAPLSNLDIIKNIFKSDKESFTLQPMYASYLRYIIKKRIYSDCLEPCSGCDKCFVNFETIMQASQTEILKEHEIISGKDNQHYILKKKRIRQYDPNNTKLSELELGELGLKARNRQDLSRLRKAYNKLDISPKFKDTLSLKDIRINGLKYLGVNINKKTKVNI